MKRLSVMSLAALALLAALPAPASAGIEIRKIAFDPKGPDSGTNAHLNKEFVYLENTGARRVDLSGWKLHDKGRDHVYRFSDLRLSPGDTLTLRTGRGDDAAAVCGGDCPVYYYSHWNLRHYVWNNRGDVATLRRANGTIADRCRYGRAATNPKRC